MPLIYLYFRRIQIKKINKNPPDMIYVNTSIKKTCDLLKLLDFK